MPNRDCGARQQQDSTLLWLSEMLTMVAVQAASLAECNCDQKPACPNRSSLPVLTLKTER